MLSALQYSSGPRCSVKLKVFTPLFSQSPVLSNHGNTPADPSQETRRAADEAADEAAGGGVTATIEDSSLRTAGRAGVICAFVFLHTPHAKRCVVAAGRLLSAAPRGTVVLLLRTAQTRQQPR